MRARARIPSNLLRARCPLHIRYFILLLIISVESTYIGSANCNLARVFVRDTQSCAVYFTLKTRGGRKGPVPPFHNTILCEKRECEPGAVERNILFGRYFLAIWQRYAGGSSRRQRKTFRSSMKLGHRVVPTGSRVGFIVLQRAAWREGAEI